LKGVIVAGRPLSMKDVEEEIDRTDLRLRSRRRRRTSLKATTPIRASKAATPPATAPAITRVCDCVIGEVSQSKSVALAFIAMEGTLQVWILSGIKQSRECFVRTSKVMARTWHLVRD
jgi:hypothetical protein